jgi:hypothetical protein
VITDREDKKRNNKSFLVLLQRESFRSVGNRVKVEISTLYKVKSNLLAVVWGKTGTIGLYILSNVLYRA